MTDIDGTDARLIVDDGATVALEDLTAVRITATIQSDDCVVYEAEKQTSAGSTQTVSATRRDGRFRWVKRDTSSGYAEDGTGTVRNDADTNGPMERFAERLRTAREPLMSGISASLPWLDWTYHLGERLGLLAGPDISLRTGPDDDPAYPVIEEISYELVAQNTVLAFRAPGAGDRG